MWTSSNRKPIFAIIAHWITSAWEEREEVLEFLEVYGAHSGEELAAVVQRLLIEFNLQGKLYTITGDNASNNGTLYESLFYNLCKDYSDEGLLGKKPMHFHGKASWIRCFAHVIALICGDVLKELKAGTAVETKKLLDNWEKNFGNRDYTIPFDEGRSSIAKVRLLNLWILRSTLHEQYWSQMSNCRTRRPIYDVDSRWNSMYDMIVQYLELIAEYRQFVKHHKQVHTLALTETEELALHQLAAVLKPFKTITLSVSETMSEVGQSLSKYWELDVLLDNVANGIGVNAELHQSVKNAFAIGRKKYLKYSQKLEKNALLYAAHILDPRYRVESIKEMMPNQVDEVLEAATAYLYKEWPELLEPEDSESLPAAGANTLVIEADIKPANMPLAVFRTMQKKKAAALAVNQEPQARTKQLQRWINIPTLPWDSDSDYCRK